jgi:peptide-methionine (S)-S-oxide reductase
LPGVCQTEAGRANGTKRDTQGDYDGYVECVKTVFDPKLVTVEELMAYLFEIIDPYSLNQQGNDVGEKYRTGVYSLNPNHLEQASDWIMQRSDSEKVALEVRPLTHYLRSDEAHQDRLTRYPDEICHLPKELLHKYKK